MAKGKSTAPTLADIEDLARATLGRIPAPLRQKLTDLVVQVVDFPDDETIRLLALNTPYDLLGMYSGVSLERKSVTVVPDDVDIIFLYRRPLLDYWIECGEELHDIVRNVLIHEIGHHFGFSDAAMAAIEDTEG
ncbi:MAG: metallopeptidase family protein [Rhodospirillaceae bacterium]|mgnify:FL=1|jgi:predicted Zn-dependent protease with MMP-like domain|nr:metallopeptidase family protein [Rhodospirillaceae bacterium]